jgi:hypothetical protein
MKAKDIKPGMHIKTRFGPLTIKTNTEDRDRGMCRFTFFEKSEIMLSNAEHDIEIYNGTMFPWGVK